MRLRISNRPSFVTVALTIFLIVGMLTNWPAVVRLRAAAPTISAYSNSSLTDTGNTETTGSVSWNNGDVVLVMGVTEDNVAKLLNTPTTTGTGLSFAAVSGFPTNTNSNAKIYAWSATASATSSGTISATRADTDIGHRMIAVIVASGSSGIGNAATAVTDTTDPYTASLTRAGANSAVMIAAGDWNAVSDTLTDPSPSTGATERVGDNACFVSLIYNCYIATWADGGAAGTTAYGVANFTGGQVAIGAVEVKGTASATSPKQLPLLGCCGFGRP